MTRVLGNGSYEDLMADVFRVMLRHDPEPPSSDGTAVNATLGIDNIQLVGAPLLAADFDEDGDVDGDDFLNWQASFGNDGGGDADSDGDTDGDDFLIWQSEFGPGHGSVSANVPEPTSIALALVMAAMGTISLCGGISRPSRRVSSTHSHDGIAM